MPLSRLLNTTNGLACLIRWLSILLVIIPAVLGFALWYLSNRKDALQKVIDDEKDRKLQRLEKQQRPRLLSDRQKQDAIGRLQPATNPPDDTVALDEVERIAY